MKESSMTGKEVVEFAKKHDCKMVDYKFLDFIGIWQHFSQPISMFSEETFEEGIGFDGSSIRGWQPIHNSDMLLLPDPTTAKIDPFPKTSTLSLICNIIDPFTREGYTRDPRFVAQKAEAYLKSSCLADTCYFGPEP
jgi:glutamine synthetase